MGGSAAVPEPREWSEEHLRTELAYCKARLFDIDRAPPGSRHREGRARIVRQIEEYEQLLAKRRQETASDPGRDIPFKRPRMF